MNWVKRGLWLAAWGCWAWLGWGLSRELPRAWTPGLCRVPKELVGFIHHDDLAVCKGTIRPWELDCLDARNGAPKFPSTRIMGAPDRVSLRHGFVVGVDLDATRAGARVDKLRAFDLRAGTWTLFDAQAGAVCDVHPTLPLIAVRQPGGPRKELRVAVIDLKTPKSLRMRQGAPPAAGTVEQLQACYFTGADDEILLLIDRYSESGVGSQTHSLRFEHWSPSRGRLGDPVTIPREYGDSTKAALDRITLIGTQSDASAYDVLDHRTGATVLSSESLDANRGGRRRGWPINVLLSPSGRAVLGRSNCLWRVDDGRPLWTGGAHETIVSAEPGAARFGVLEDWTTLAVRFPWLPHLNTFAVRDLDTGAVAFRVWGPGPESKDLGPGVRYAMLKRDVSSPDGDKTDQIIVPLPPPPNYSLLALCQSVLALPLVLTWLALRWRRKRRRMTGAAS